MARMRKLTSDWATLLLAVSLICTIAGIVLLVHFDGEKELAGTGLGGLTVVLGTALAARVRRNGNGGS